MVVVQKYYQNHFAKINKDYDPGKYERYVSAEFNNYLKDNSKSVLDLGAGAGFLLRTLEERGFRDLTGVEISSDQMDHANAILKISKMHNANVMDFLRENTRKYDIIFLMDVLEHLSKEDIMEIIKLIKKSLNKGGVFLMQTANACSPLFGLWNRYVDITHTIAFTPESLGMVFREAGFESFEIRECKFYTDNEFINFPKKFLRKFGDFVLRTYMATYMGKTAYRHLLTYNLIAEVQNVDD